MDIYAMPGSTLLVLGAALVMSIFYARLNARDTRSKYLMIAMREKMAEMRKYQARFKETQDERYLRRALRLQKEVLELQKIVFSVQLKRMIVSMAIFFALYYALGILYGRSPVAYAPYRIPRDIRSTPVEYSGRLVSGLSFIARYFLSSITFALAFQTLFDKLARSNVKKGLKRLFSRSFINAVPRAIMRLDRRIFVLKRNPENPEASELIPEGGIPAYRDLSRIENKSLHATMGDIMSLYNGVEAIFGPVFTIEKSGKRAMVYFTTEHEIRVAVQDVPIEEFVSGPLSDTLIKRYGERVRKLIQGTGVIYPYYRIEPGEIFYIPYTNSFAIALRRVRFRGLMLRLGRVEGEEYLRFFEEARVGVDKIVMRPVRERI